MHYVLFTGGRDVDGHEAQVAMHDTMEFLSLFYGVGLRVMHGGARGVDTLAQQAADHFNVTSKAFPADWGRGKKAGIERNIHMGELLVDWEAQGHSVEVIAFPGGRGTAHMATFAGKLGLNVTHIAVDGYGVVAQTA